MLSVHLVSCPGLHCRPDRIGSLQKFEAVRSANGSIGRQQRLSTRVAVASPGANSRRQSKHRVTMMTSAASLAAVFAQKENVGASTSWRLALKKDAGEQPACRDLIANATEQQR